MIRYITKKYLRVRLNDLHKEYLKISKTKDNEKLKKVDNDIFALLHVLNEVI